jgi:hypothetical protein
VEWYTKSVEEGNALVQFNLGNCYYNGQGVPQDYKKAVECYTKASEAGNDQARHNLSFYYKKENIFHQDKKSVEVFEKANEGKYSVGVCYQKGSFSQENVSDTGIAYKYDLSCVKCGGKIECWIEDYCIDCKKIFFRLKKSKNPFSEFEESLDVSSKRTLYKRILSCFGK